MESNWELGIVAVLAFVAVGLLLGGLILWARSRLINTAPCKIFINDEENSTIEAAGGCTLLGALQGNKIAVPSPCGGKATCKQCRVQVVSGAGQILEPDKATFSKKELAAGWRLSCQYKIKQDLRIKIPHELLDVKEFEGTVISNQNVATFIKELVVEIPIAIEYRSGSYMQFHIPPFKTHTSDWRESMDPNYFSDWEKFHLFDQTIDFSDLQGDPVRAYSMASYPAEGNKLMFNIRIATPPKENVPWGLCSSYLFSLKPGDSVRLSGPYGESFMRPGDSPIVFLIGGAGSSFGRSHILHLFKTEQTNRKIDLWYGARSLKENIYEQEYLDLARDSTNFTYHLVLSEPLPEDKWPSREEDPVRTNFLFKAFELGQLSKMESPEDALYYVCGPPMHNKSVMKLLDDYGVPRENIVLDDFGS